MKIISSKFDIRRSCFPDYTEKTAGSEIIATANDGVATGPETAKLPSKCL